MKTQDLAYLALLESETPEERHGRLLHILNDLTRTTKVSARKYYTPPPVKYQYKWAEAHFNSYDYNIKECEKAGKTMEDKFYRETVVSKMRAKDKMDALTLGMKDE
jgi:hypothetical protein